MSVIPGGGSFQKWKTNWKINSRKGWRHSSSNRRPWVQSLILVLTKKRERNRGNFFRACLPRAHIFPKLVPVHLLQSVCLAFGFFFLFFGGYPGVYLFIYLFAVLGLELRASLLLGRHSIIWDFRLDNNLIGIPPITVHLLNHCSFSLSGHLPLHLEWAYSIITSVKE
jgi:hypothetical protein